MSVIASHSSHFNQLLFHQNESQLAVHAKKFRENFPVEQLLDQNEKRTDILRSVIPIRKAVRRIKSIKTLVTFQHLANPSIIFDLLGSVACGGFMRAATQLRMSL